MKILKSMLIFLSGNLVARGTQRPEADKLVVCDGAVANPGAGHKESNSLRGTRNAEE